MKKFGSLLGFIAIAQVIGGSSGIVTAKSIRDGWYDGLDKPKWTPPNAVFGPVWTILFAFMGIAAWRVWRRREQNPEETKTALTWWSVQLLLNAAWSILFFGFRKPKWAWLEIFALWGSIVFTMRSLWKRDQVAGTLFLPYLAWTSFAAALTTSIAWRNDD
ncbi:tryptophan-rich sensory protein [bacterium]|nr:MAG: tryptophan-rich sensory protein [bacterium]